MKLVKELNLIADEIMEENSNLPRFQALHIAAKVQENRILEDAYLLHGPGPSALEAIAMELGASKDGDTIKSAIYSLQQ